MTRSKPILLTVSSHTGGMPRFLESLKNVDVEHLVVQFNPETPGLKSDIHHDISYPGHLQKYAYFPRDIDPERWVVFTDTDDVIFQTSLPDFDKLGYDLYLAPENVVHRGSWWESYINERPEFRELLDLEIYNSGCWAMKARNMYKLLDFQEEIGRRGNLCQCYFNLFIARNPHLYKHEDRSIFCALHANIHRPDINKIDGIWRYGGDIIPCVHGNGSLKGEL